MADGIGGILGGLGLFFAGMWLLSENLKVLAGYRLRILATRWIPDRFAAFGWGMLAGSVVQSMTTLTFVAGSARQAGLISADRAFSIVLGGNIGTSLLVLIVAFDLEVAALCVLGAAGAAMASGWTGRYRNHATLLFGLAAVFVGLFLAKESAAPFADHVWVGDLAKWMSYSLWFAFVGAALLAFVMQSVMPVIILGIGMTAIDVISVDQLLMIAYGAWTGSSFLLLALSANLTSASRQVAAYQMLVNIVSLAIFMPIHFVEIHSDIPLMKAAMLATDMEVGQQMGLFIVLTNIIPAALLFPVLDPAVRQYEKLWPMTRLERMSQTRYIHDRAFNDLDMALILAELEQYRVLAGLSEYLGAVRGNEAISELNRANGLLISQIEEFLEEAKTHHPAEWTEHLNSVLVRQRILIWLDEQVVDLCKMLNSVPDRSGLTGLKSSVVEGLDAVLLVIVQEAQAAGDAAEHPFYAARIVDRGGFMRDVRDMYLREDAGLSREERSGLLRITNIVELVFFLLIEFMRQAEQRKAA